MKQTRYRLMHQVVSDEKGRPKILHVVVERAGGSRVGGPFYDWRLAQRLADELNARTSEAPPPSVPAMAPAKGTAAG